MKKLPLYFALFLILNFFIGTMPCFAGGTGKETAGDHEDPPANEHKALASIPAPETNAAAEDKAASSVMPKPKSFIFYMPNRLKMQFIQDPNLSTCTNPLSISIDDGVSNSPKRLNIIIQISIEQEGEGYFPIFEWYYTNEINQHLSIDELSAIRPYMSSKLIYTKHPYPQIDPAKVVCNQYELYYNDNKVLTFDMFISQISNHGDDIAYRDFILRERII